MAERGLGMVIGDGQARTNPVHEQDVARVCVDALSANVREHTVGGPEIFTRREIVELAFSVIGEKPRIVSVPPGLMRAMRRPVKLLDQRLADFLSFGTAVSTMDIVSPPLGTGKPGEYFQQLRQRRVGSVSADPLSMGRT